MPTLANTRLTPEQLTHSIERQQLAFNSTEDIDAFHGVLGQERAVNAIQFGVAMKRPGYNIFVMGETGTGRSSYVREYLRIEGKRQATPDAWCYVNHFSNPREPRALKLRPSEASVYIEHINDLIDQLLATFPAVFEHPSYQQQKAAIDYLFNRRYDKAIEQIEREAHKRGVAVYRDSSAISFTPMREGKALDESEFAQLPESERDAFHNTIAELEQMLGEQLSELPQWKRESSNSLRELNQETIKEAVTPLLQPLREQFASNDEVTQYLNEVEEFLPRLVLEELVEERLLELREEYNKRTSLEDALLPNLATQHQSDSGAPVVYEPHPSYANLFGRIEYANEQGALVTNYRRISPGALHKANGGYLIVDAEKILSEPLVWDALKRALQSGQLKMESPYAELGMLNTTTLLPQTIPLRLKLVLIGSRQLYYLLQEYDEDFRRLFRAVVDFDGDLSADKEHVMAYARLLRSRIDEQQMAHMTQAGVLRMLEFSARLAERQDAISARIGEQFDLLSEADFLRQLTGDANIDDYHIERALSAKKDRTGRVYDKLFEQMLDGTVLLQTEGEAIGNINGLTVMSLGDTSFGSPARITTTVYPGSRGIVDIEREVALGQAIHSKGVMIISGFLGHRYARDFPLAITAHIAMEQSYGHIDGDSASLAELVCLISALIRSPIDQSYAVTGSVNQYGEVQAIGGANEKIEGFFRLCQARGLTGKQGVIIPAANQRNLVLSQTVIDAVQQGQFHIHAVDHVDQALNLLLQRPAGALGKRGHFPKGSVNADVVEQLKRMQLSSTEAGKSSRSKSKTSG